LQCIGVPIQKQTEHVEFAVDDGLFVDDCRKQDITSFVLDPTSTHLNVVLTATSHRSVLRHFLLYLQPHIDTDTLEFNGIFNTDELNSLLIQAMLYNERVKINTLRTIKRVVGF